MFFFSNLLPGRKSCCSSGWAVFGFLGPVEGQLWTSLTIWRPPPGRSLQTNVTEKVHLAVRLRSFDQVMTPVALLAFGHRTIRMSDLYTLDDAFRKMQCYVWLSGRQISLNGTHLWNDILHHWNGKAIAFACCEFAFEPVGQGSAAWDAWEPDWCTNADAPTAWLDKQTRGIRRILKLQTKQTIFPFAPRPHHTFFFGGIAEQALGIVGRLTTTPHFEHCVVSAARLSMRFQPVWLTSSCSDSLLHAPLTAWDRSSGTAPRSAGQPSRSRMPWSPLPQKHPLQWRPEWLVQRAVPQ